MKHKWRGLVLGSFLLAAMTACSDDQSSALADQTNDAETKTPETSDVFDDIRSMSQAYMEDPDFEVITGKELYDRILFDDPNDYVIVDVRDTTTFAAGHIPGAVNIPFRISGNENMYLELPEEKDIYVVCFSGHTASQTVGLLNVLGYNAKAVQFGMGGYANGTGLGSDIPGGAAGFDVVTTGFETVDSFNLPVIESSRNLESAVFNQSQVFLDKELPGVMGAPAVKEMIEEGDLEGYQLIDIRLEEHYDNGHVNEAVNIPYDELFTAEQLEKLDPESMTVVIGYNGYDASQVTRLLGQLDYKATPMAYGMSIWSGEEEIVGEYLFDFTKVFSLPTDELNFDLDGGAVETGCS